MDKYIGLFGSVVLWRALISFPGDRKERKIPADAKGSIASTGIGRERAKAGAVGVSVLGTVSESVPATGLAVNFSPMPRMAIAVFGQGDGGRRDLMPIGCLM